MSLLRGIIHSNMDHQWNELSKKDLALDPFIPLKTTGSAAVHSFLKFGF